MLTIGREHMRFLEAWEPISETPVLIGKCLSSGSLFGVRYFWLRNGRNVVLRVFASEDVAFMLALLLGEVCLYCFVPELVTFRVSVLSQRG